MNIAVSTLPMTTTRSADMRVRVECMRREANDIVSLELGAADGRPLPGWSPGSHIRLHLPSGLIRQYSLCGPLAAGAPYRIGVHRVRDGRGGSAEVHDALRVGSILAIDGPLNNFKLVDAERYLFIAGGIGVTPILSMIAAVDCRSEWTLVYGGRSRADMAFLSEIERRPRDRVTLLSENEKGRPDLARLIEDAAPGTQVYACGPPAMLDALVAVCAARPDVALHIERFCAPAAKAPDAQRAEDGTFEVVLQRSGMTLTIPPGRTILEEVRKVMPGVPFSCESGYCGTCEARVIEGDIDHRDSLLSAEERATNKTMMICVSRAAGGRIVLDM